MFCHGCVMKYLNACLILIRIAQATVKAWLAGDIPATFLYVRRFVQLWNGLYPWGRSPA